MDAFLVTVKQGARQADAVANARHAAAHAGAEQAVLYMGAGESPWFWGDVRGDEVFTEGDIVGVEVSARYHGYYGRVCRTMLVGNVSEQKRRMLDATRAAHDAMLPLVRPGVTGQDLFRAASGVLNEHGFEVPAGQRFGHGLEMSIGEGFNVSEDDVTPIPENAYMVMHPMLYKADIGACSMCGDQFFVRRGGAELLTRD